MNNENENEIIGIIAARFFMGIAIDIAIAFTISKIFYQDYALNDNIVNILLVIFSIRIIVLFRNWIQGCIWAFAFGKKIFHDKIYNFISKSSIPKPDQIFGPSFKFDSGKYLAQKILANENVECKARIEAMTVWFLYKLQENSLSKTELKIFSQAADRAVHKWASGR